MKKKKKGEGDGGGGKKRRERRRGRSRRCRVKTGGWGSFKTRRIMGLQKGGGEVAVTLLTHM